MPLSYDDFEDSLRRKRALLRLIVVIVWGVGVAFTIKSGFVPGYWWDGRPWPYPLGHVLVALAQVTLVSLCLYDLLRPQPEGSSIGRTGRAAAVALITFVWIEMNSWTDQSLHISVDVRSVLTTEMLFREDSLQLWLPVQAVLVPSFRSELKRGDLVTLFVGYVGAEGQGSVIDWVFVVNEFEKR